LVRVICSKCKQPHPPSDAELEYSGITKEMAEGATFMKGAGCSSCQQSGFRGRLGIFELMPMTSRIRELAFQGASTQDIRKAAISEGMSTLYDDGIQKVLKGITTLPEVHRVAKRVVS
jgi:type IV pilus assembly protein PilB